MAKENNVQTLQKVRNSRSKVPNTAVSGPFRPSWTHLPCRRQQLASCHPQLTQRKQREQLGGVLGQPPIAYFHVAKLTLDHPKRMLYFGAHRRLQGFDV